MYRAFMVHAVHSGQSHTVKKDFQSSKKTKTLAELQENIISVFLSQFQVKSNGYLVLFCNNLGNFLAIAH